MWLHIKRILSHVKLQSGDHETVNNANGSVTSPPHNQGNQGVRSHSSATMATSTVAKMVWRPMETGKHDNELWLAPNIICIS